MFKNSPLWQSPDAAIVFTHAQLWFASMRVLGGTLVPPASAAAELSAAAAALPAWKMQKSVFPHLFFPISPNDKVTTWKIHPFGSSICLLFWNGKMCFPAALKQAKNLPFLNGSLMFNWT